ncbi:hypothetical protein [Paracoccus sp. IB05]|uniref:hypothetical protein n=1 Tax=Paracoccus sp. IB05 TaxID=2779367 RepID=UPI0018E80F27|nr:hypothetical protein [Paracoccus sp. IB05]MBJ2151793.1 hypothetical protein [Paracoccus sp. IB05]
MAHLAPDQPIGPERFYREMSPQLAARLRQMWSARGHDLDRLWGECIRGLPGFRALPPVEKPGANSRAHDRLCMFDQALIWTMALNRAAGAGMRIEGLRLGRDQFCALQILSGRVVESVSAIRLLVLTELAVPALQLARSVSEDVDMALALLLRRKLAQQFVACRSAEEANDFWRRHIAGGRAFRLVAEKLYAIGLDHSDQSEYGRWRREVLTLLGSAVHSSPLGQGARGREAAWPANPVARDCLDFVTHRLHELCAWAHLIEIGLEEDLVLISSTAPPEARLLACAAGSRDILLDQMRWALVGQGADQGDGTSGPEAAGATPDAGLFNAGRALH